MVRKPLRLFRKACCVVATAALLLTLLLHLGWTPWDEDLRVEDTLRPLLPPREDSPRNFSSSHRHLFHIFDTQSSLPARFRVVDLRSRWKLHPVEVKDTNFRCVVSKTSPSFTVCTYPPHRDKFISASLLSSGIWEPYITFAFQTALERHPTATVIDVGANLGYYSLLASAMGHKVVALEPQFENIKRFVAGTRADPWSDNIVLLANALSDGHRNISLSHNADNQGGIHVLENCGRPWSFGRETASRDDDCSVATLTLDDLLYVVTTRVAIIKIDIEGYECKALATGSEFFSAIKVPYLFMEWRQMTDRQHRQQTACRPGEIRALGHFLADRGYVPHEVRSGIKLNSYNAEEWRVGDVYWRLGDQNLLVPSM